MKAQLEIIRVALAGFLTGPKSLDDALHIIRTTEAALSSLLGPRSPVNLPVVFPTEKPPSYAENSQCSNYLQHMGKAYPRTCQKCGLGPCKDFKLRGENPFDQPTQEC